MAFSCLNENLLLLAKLLLGSDSSFSTHLFPCRYIHQDPHIFPMLKMLKQSGRMTFLVTNRSVSLLLVCDIVESGL
jgi:hypothetical protein